ncbi:hypothetical protein AB0F91_43165 [Amycolatopsis sp. NPDC023774]|uniref:hypothetical protein n=1 Tax=Amycolatopsis sp. NPDC023774 TaxID=3155015 RepID=UPI0033D889F8
MRNVVIVGAGIVGAALAAELAADFPVEVKKTLTGSTGYAPRFIALFNEARVLTELARAGAARYDEILAGFSCVGGLEVATTVDRMRDLE